MGVQDRDRGGEVRAVGGEDGHLDRGEGSANDER